MYRVDPAALSRQYKEHISDYRQWEQLSHAEDFVLFKSNLGSQLSMDETCLSQGELYTIVTNKAARGRTLHNRHQQSGAMAKRVARGDDQGY